MLGERRRVVKLGNSPDFSGKTERTISCRRLEVMNDNEMIDGEYRKVERSLFFYCLI